MTFKSSNHSIKSNIESLLTENSPTTFESVGLLYSTTNSEQNKALPLPFDSELDEDNETDSSYTTTLACLNQNISDSVEKDMKKLGQTSSLPFMTTRYENRWDLTTNDLLSSPCKHVSHNKYQNQHNHIYGHLEQPTRNGAASMPHICSNTCENMMIVSPNSFVDSGDIGCPFPIKAGALEVLQGKLSSQMIITSVGVDQFGLPIWPVSAVVEQESEILALIRHLEPTPKEQENQIHLFNDISMITKELFKTSKLVRFGSTVNGFSLRGADVDFCLFVGDIECTSDDEENNSTVAEIVLTRLGATLMTHSRFTQIKVLTRARVPIIKLKDLVTGTSCDIGVNNSLALHNTRLLFLYGQYDPKVLSLARVIKWWARKRAMNDSYWGTLSSYCLLMMLIFYLQQGENPILPVLTSDLLIEKFKQWRKTSSNSSISCVSSITEILVECSISSEPSFNEFISSFGESNANGSGAVEILVDGKFNVKYISDIASLKKMLSQPLGNKEDETFPIRHQLPCRNLYSLLAGFFKFYTQTFSFSTEVVSPRSGKACSKESKQWSIQSLVSDHVPSSNRGERKTYVPHSSSISKKGPSEKGKNTKEFAIQFDKFLHTSVLVKFSGGRQVTGVLRGHDPLFNLVLDDAVELVTRSDEPQTTRNLGRLICRGSCVLVVSPIEGSMQIENPFANAE